MEKRRFRRTDFGTHGTFTSASQTVGFELIDLSLKGALINPLDSAVLKVGDAGSVTIELSGTDAVITADAEIVHREYEYFGLRFTMIDLDSVTHLRRLIELNTPEDGDLERELGFLIQK
ncbi:MAG: PilZ domain-containing protein [Spirochaetaceae bacterium]|nr:MAG: PilZ domain-containing protein [Spirochaetaceae bacterium]